MADVDLVVRERRRVVDVDGTTTFQIRLRNYGTKEATKLQVSAKLSDNLVVDRDRPAGPRRRRIATDGRGEVPDHRATGPGKEMILGIKVKVTKPQPKIGDLPDLPAPRRPDRAAGGHGRRQGHRIPPRRQRASP